jgi:hypothetical protein
MCRTLSAVEGPFVSRFIDEGAREALGSQELTALADRGYYSGEEIKACEDAVIVPLVPKVFTSNSKAEGHRVRLQ